MLRFFCWINFFLQMLMGTLTTNAMAQDLQSCYCFKEPCFCNTTFTWPRPQTNLISCSIPPCPTANRFCPTCTGFPATPIGQNNLGFQPFWNPYFQSQFSPWSAFQRGQVYAPYYPQPHYPHWNPGRGELVMAKPVVYVRDGNGKKFHLTFDFKGQGQLMVTVPQIPPDLTWSFEVKNNQFVVDQVNYETLFYDARTSTQGIQQERGFCGSRGTVLQKMEQGLKDWDFPDAAVKEFKHHWKAKLIPSDSYCVFPQTDQEMDSVLTIRVSPEPMLYRRVQYYVVPEEYFQTQTRKPASQAQGAFQNKPKQPYSFKKPTVLIKKGPKFYDWGLGFVMGNPL